MQSMFSQTTEYALRIIVFLASREGKPATTREIAHFTRVPEGYLSKVLQGLSRAGMVSSQRGLHGGSVLRRPPGEITILDVINSVDPLPRIRSCPLGLRTHGVNLCPLHKRLDGAMEQVEKAFADSTIADLLAEPTSSTPLCEMPPLPPLAPSQTAPASAAADKRSPAPARTRRRR
jgi:Rrf2 family protein